MANDHFLKYFQESYKTLYTYKDKTSEFTFSLTNVGQIKISSGQICVFDVMSMEQPKPFTIKVPNGSHPVILSVAQINTDKRVFFSMVKFGNNEVRKWVMALKADEDISTLKEGDVFGFGVDSGRGCIADPESGTVMYKKIKESIDYFNQVNKKLRENYVNTFDYGEIHPQEGSDSNVILFSTGYGDGFYASYFGLDENNKPAVLVSDLCGALNDDERQFRKDILTFSKEFYTR